MHQKPTTTTSRRSSRGSASSDRSGHERHLYRQGSLGSQIGGSGIELHSLGSRGNFSYRSRVSSGKSIRSRVASRSEYHQDLKPDLEQVCLQHVVICFSPVLLLGQAFLLFGFVNDIYKSCFYKAKQELR